MPQVALEKIVIFSQIYLERVDFFVKLFIMIFGEIWDCTENIFPNYIVDMRERSFE